MLRHGVCAAARHDAAEAPIAAVGDRSMLRIISGGNMQAKDIDRFLAYCEMAFVDNEDNERRLLRMWSDGKQGGREPRSHNDCFTHLV